MKNNNKHTYIFHALPIKHNSPSFIHADQTNKVTECISSTNQTKCVAVLSRGSEVNSDVFLPQNVVVVSVQKVNKLLFSVVNSYKKYTD